MKELKIILLVFLSLFIFTGCVESKTTMDINKDKSAKMQTTYLVDDSLTSMNEDQKIDTDSEEMKNLTKLGYKVKAHKKDDMSGVIIINDIKNIDDVSSTKKVEFVLSDLLEDGFNQKNMFQVKKGFFQNEYIANIKYDLTSEESDDSDENSEYMESFMSSIEFSYTLNTDNKVVKNNADTISKDKQKYTWNIKYGKETSIKYTFKVLNYINIIIVSVVAVLLIAGIATAIIILLKKKSKNVTKKETAEPEKKITPKKKTASKKTKKSKK